MARSLKRFIRTLYQESDRTKTETCYAWLCPLGWDLGLHRLLCTNSFSGSYPTELSLLLASLQTSAFSLLSCNNSDHSEDTGERRMLIHNLYAL